MYEIREIHTQEVLGVDFRVYGSVEAPLFLAKDVANWIDYDTNKVGQMLKNVDEDEKVTSPIYYSGQVREMYFLTEDGVYEVLMQSRKPVAKAFKKEVKNILKQIRQTGGYIPVSQEDDEATIMAKALNIMQKTLDKKDQLIEAQKPKVQYFDAVLDTNDYKSTTQIAKDFGMSATKLNKILKGLGVQFKRGSHGTWYLYSKYDYLVREGYAKYKKYPDKNIPQSLQWSEKGRQWIYELLKENGYIN